MYEENVYELLEETYGLELILEQNDIEVWQVLQLLHLNGLLDLSDYFFEELEVGEDD